MRHRLRFGSLLSSLLLVLLFSSLAVAASKMTISPSNPRLLSNSSLQFTALINGELIDGPVKWTSSNAAVATIAGTNGSATARLLSAGTSCPR